MLFHWPVLNTWTCWSIFLQSVVETVTHWRQLEHTHLKQGVHTLNLTHSQHFWLLKLDLMVWISLVPQWSRMEVNIFGYLNGNCSMVPLFKEDSQVSIISIPQFLPYRISFTLPPLQGTRWTLVQFLRFCDLWTSQRNRLKVPVQLSCPLHFHTSMNV